MQGVSRPEANCERPIPIQRLSTTRTLSGSLTTSPGPTTRDPTGATANRQSEAVSDEAIIEITLITLSSPPVSYTKRVLEPG